MKNIFILLLGFYGLVGCKQDKYISNRFAGIYEITEIRRETWDSTGKISEETLKCGYKFYLEAPIRPDFGNGLCRFDTLGTEPSFLDELKLYAFTGNERFSCEWSIGPGDNVRLSFIKPDPSNIGDKSESVNIKRNSIGKVIAWTLFKPTPGGGFVYEEFVIK